MKRSMSLLLTISLLGGVVGTTIPTVYGETATQTSETITSETKELTTETTEETQATATTETSSSTATSTAVTSETEMSATTSDSSDSSTEVVSSEATTEEKTETTDTTDKEKSDKQATAAKSEADEIGKGENFSSKKYLDYLHEKLAKTVANNVAAGKTSDEILNSLVTTLGLESMMSFKYQVDKSVINHLLATYLLYDIAFPKDSLFYPYLGSLFPNDGTTPSEEAGFYPGTDTLTGTTVNRQNQEQMNLRAYYVDQGSDKTVMIHGGFRGNWNNGTQNIEYDMFYQKGYNLLFVDSRATGGSGGDYVTYGQYESDDVLYWINQEVQRNSKQQILLYGGSMGAATMMSVLAKDVPTNVKGIIENCGFASIDSQLRSTYTKLAAALPEQVQDMLDVLPDEEHADLFMGLLKENYFDQELALNTTENLPMVGMTKSTIPKLIIHGDSDDLVPVQNAYDLYENANSYKEKFIVPTALHGKSQEVDPEGYGQRIDKFLDIVFNRNVTVSYLDENGEKLADDTQLTGSYGDTYQAEEKAFTGYRLKNVTGQATGTFNEENPTVTYQYEKVATKPVTIEYRDKGTDTLLDKQVIKGAFGESYDFSSQKYILDFDGYTLDKDVLPTNLSGTFDEKGQTIVFYYQKDSEPAKEPKEDKKNPAKSNGTQQSKKALPKTGMTSEQPLVIAGIMLLGATILGWFWRKKQAK